MPEIGLSGLMSGDGKRGVGHRPEAAAPILDLYEGAAVKEYFGGLAILIAPGYGFRRAVKSRRREVVRRRRRT